MPTFLDEIPACPVGYERATITLTFDRPASEETDDFASDLSASSFNAGIRTAASEVGVDPDGVVVELKVCTDGTGRDSDVTYGPMLLEDAEPEGEG